MNFLQGGFLNKSVNNLWSSSDATSCIQAAHPTPACHMLLKGPDSPLHTHTSYPSPDMLVIFPLTVSSLLHPYVILTGSPSSWAGSHGGSVDGWEGAELRSGQRLGSS